MLIKNSENFLDRLVEGIQVSPARYENAARAYRSLQNWFVREQSSVRDASPDTYLQGSFRLGTAIRPTTDEDDYDLDIVVELAKSKNAVSQKQLKRMVGAEVRSYSKSKGMSEPKDARRCWTQDYADGSRFHVDTLPAIPDEEGLKTRLEARGLSQEFVSEAIAITDKTDPNYAVVNPRWNNSNPRGYAQWFESRMGERLTESRQKIALSEGAKLDEIPTYRVQTPLQKAIQLLKFHRDVRFADDTDDKPISIIITTLAAHAYQGERELDDALNTILRDMDKFIEQELGVDWVRNPTNAAENFADKWVEYPARRKNFYDWLRQAQDDFLQISIASSQERTRLLREAFGDEAVQRGFGGANALRNREKRTSVLADHREQPRWPVRISGKAKIKKATWATPSTYRTRPFSSDGSPIPKGKDLRFYGTTDIVAPYEVHWQITNTGEEAQRANCARGTFEVGSLTSGKIMRKEKTAYRGSHTVECFIVKDGLVAARSGQFVVNIE